MQEEKRWDAGLKNVIERNFFYRKNFHIALGFCLLVVFLDVMLIVVASYLVRHPTQPIYFPVDNAGRLIKEVPLQQSILSDQKVTDWVVHAVESAYSYNFFNYREQLQSAQKYFTEAGWREYMRGLDRSRNLIALSQRKLVATAKVVSKPKLLRRGLMSNGVLAWRFEMEVLMHYQSPPFDDKSGYYNPLFVSVVVRRQDVLQSENGLGIVQLTAFTAS